MNVAHVTKIKILIFNNVTFVVVRSFFDIFVLSVRMT